MDIETRAVYMLPTTDPHQNQGYRQTKSEGMENDNPCKWKLKEKKKAEVPTLISDKIDFKIKIVKRDKERHDLMVERSTQRKI